jgi:hypothetical protein
MTRPTKQTQAARLLLSTLIEAIEDTSALENIETYDLLLNASKLIGKPGDKEVGLLNNILTEVKLREDIKEVPADLLLNLTVSIINKTGEKQEGVTKEEILKNKANLSNAKIKRC